MPEKTYSFTWLDGDNEKTPLTFEIQELDKKTSTDILRECRSDSSEYKRNKERAGIMENVDFLKLQRLSILKTVVGWSGMTWKLLIDLVEPDEEIVALVSGKIGSGPVPYDIETRRIIANSPSADFVNFLTFHQSKIKEIEKENLLAALGN